ncbi:multicopper oxidase domain-containing protein [Nocardia bovistercoris]|uniref:multicopper oxidase domain-containing protein n=1 Tax=Nocardia bovistercoris TaxID=2785916 RepID=UPI002FCD504B
MREVDLAAVAAVVDIGGVAVPTWTFGGRIPGAEIRVKRGEVVRARFDNRLSAPSSVHWHGPALRADMDGVPGSTQMPVAPGSGFTYEFTAAHAGTYWFHPHVGVQLDRGLYAPLVVEDPDDGAGYDLEGGGRARRQEPP